MRICLRCTYGVVDVEVPTIEKFVWNISRFRSLEDCGKFSSAQGANKLEGRPEKLIL